MQGKANSVSRVRLLYIPRTRPVPYIISAADLACSLAEELICIWFLAKTKKEMERSNLRIYLQSVWNMIDTLKSLCDTFMTNSFAKIQRNITSKRRNHLAKRHLLTVLICLQFLKPSETLTQLSTSTMLTNWVVPVKSLCKGFTRVLLLLHPLRSLQDLQNQDKGGKKGNFKTTMKKGFHV